MSAHDEHEHGHGHDHHPEPLAPLEARVAAIEAVLTEQGLFDTTMLDSVVQHFEDDLSPLNGAKVVPRGPIPPTRRGCSRTAPPRSPSSGSVAPKATTWSWSRTRPPCTTSSCARCARATRGRCWDCRRPGTRRRPTDRAVREPRVLLAEMGTVVPDDVEVRVWDSSAEVRYLVLPERPAGTDDLDEAALAARVTRDSMIGVERL